MNRTSIVVAGIIGGISLGICACTNGIDHDEVKNEVVTTEVTQSSEVTQNDSSVTKDNASALLIQGLEKFDSSDELLEKNREHWVKIKDNEDIISFECYEYSKENNYPDENYSDTVLYTKYYTLNQNYIPSIYVTKHDCIQYKDEIYVKNSTDYDWSVIADLQECQEAYNNDFLRVINSIELKNDIYDRNFERNTINWIKEKSQDLYERLKNPQTAYSTWIHAGINNGGNINVIPDNYDSAWIYHTPYEYGKRGPVCAMMREVEGAYILRFFTTPNKELLDELSDANMYITNVLADRLRNDAIAELPGNDYYETEDKFYLLHNYDEFDAAFYGLAGNNGMVLRVGDNVYSFMNYWDDGGYSWLQFYCGDYDGDGDIEFAFLQCEGRGTGCSIEGLIICDIEDEQMKLRHLDHNIYYDEFERITSTFDKDKLEGVMKIDGKAVTSFTVPKDVLEEFGDVLGLNFGEFISIEVENNCFMLKANGGMAMEHMGPPNYDNSFDIAMPIMYNKDGSFSFGDIIFEGMRTEYAND